MNCASGWLRSGGGSRNWSCRFLACGSSPAATLKFERELDELLRELGRLVTELAYNRLEGEQPEAELLSKVVDG